MSQNQLVMTSGDTREFTVTITDAVGDPYDLTDADVTFTVGYADHSGAVITKTLDDGIAVADPTDGIAVITLNPDDTEDHDERRVYRYDVQVTLSDGSVHTPLRGRLIVTPDVTE